MTSNKLVSMKKTAKAKERVHDNELMEMMITIKLTIFINNNDNGKTND